LHVSQIFTAGHNIIATTNAADNVHFTQQNDQSISSRTNSEFGKLKYANLDVKRQKSGVSHTVLKLSSQCSNM